MEYKVFLIEFENGTLKPIGVQNGIAYDGNDGNDIIITYNMRLKIENHFDLKIRTIYKGSIGNVNNILIF